jgi:LacI family transcriptional regulator
MTHLGIPSVESGPPRFVAKLVEHLKSLGHTRIDYLNTAPNDTVSRDRIYYWKQALELYGLTGELFSKTDYLLGGMGLNARQYALDLYNQGQLKNTTAIICGTTEMAMGFQRGCHEVGLTVGRDISVTGFGEIYTAQLCNPSITTIRPGPKRPLLEQGLEWITTHGKDWNKPMQITSLDVDLFVGESTAPPRK